MAKKTRQVLLDLVNEISENRCDLHKMRDRMKAFDDRIETILPNSKDYEKRYLLENKIKTISEFNKIQLDVNKAIDASLKAEIELRRKLEDDANVKDNVSVRDVVRALEELDNSESEEESEE